MSRLTLALLMILLTASPAHAQRTPWGYLEKTTFLIEMSDAQGDHYGTAFCAPGRSNTLVTAAHAVNPVMTVYGWDGQEHPIERVTTDSSKDIAVVILKDRACEFSGLEFAKTNASPGTEVWLNGYGGGLEKPVM